MATIIVTSAAPINSTVAAIGAGIPFRDSSGTVYRAVGDSAGTVRPCIRLSDDFLTNLSDSTSVQVLLATDLTFDAAG
tara:strand:+ start:19843 stop:20076 length:234 start_codon:yes stop_codon:yes gene_type:complete